MSPDGRRIAVGVAENQKSDIWVCDLADDLLAPHHHGNRVVAAWTADGSDVVFAAAGEKRRNGIWRQRSTGGSPAGNSSRPTILRQWSRCLPMSIGWSIRPTTTTPGISIAWPWTRPRRRRRTSMPGT
jgi:Tol biopolymer transport system component